MRFNQALPRHVESGDDLEMRWAGIFHDFLKWFWPAVFAGSGTCIALAIAASGVWPEAKSTTGRWFMGFWTMIQNPWAIFAVAMIAFAVFLAWILAFVWSSHHLKSKAPEADGNQSVALALDRTRPFVPDVDSLSGLLTLTSPKPAGSIGVMVRRGALVKNEGHIGQLKIISSSIRGMDLIHNTGYVGGIDVDRSTFD